MCLPFVVGSCYRLYCKPGNLLHYLRSIHITHYPPELVMVQSRVSASRSSRVREVGPTQRAHQ